MPEPACVNLRERFGVRYKITLDPAHDAERMHWDRITPWLFVILCKFGDISPQGGDRLAWYAEGHRRMRAKVKRLACTETFTEGDDDGCYLFDVGDFDKVAALVQPKKRRQFTDEQREAMSERLREFQFASRRKEADERPETAA